MRRYSDAQLISAVTSSHSWRGVLRALGLAGTSGSSMRSVRAHAEQLGLDHGHFRGQRRWSDKQLAAAISSATTWTEVADTLGLSGGSSTTTLRGHAVRLGLDTSHITPRIRHSAAASTMQPNQANLSRAGTLMAAGWLEFCGHHVSWPLEPCRYDLLVWREDSAERVQVKTTTVRTGSSWMVWLSTTGQQRTPYEPDEIDSFFVVTADLDYYLIPVKVVGGLMSIQLSAYEAYRLPRMLVPTGELADATVKQLRTVPQSEGDPG